MAPLKPGVNVCAYCKKSAHGLTKINNRLLNFMRQHDSSYNRNTVFCSVCKARAELKLDRREQNMEAAAKRAKRSVGSATSSYSSTTGHFLSESTGSEPSKRSREEAGPSRSVGKRTGGKPSRREGENDDDNSESSNNNRSSSQSQQTGNQRLIPLFQVPASTNTSSSSSTQRSNSQRNQSDNRSIAANIEYANDTDDEQNGNGAQSGDSFQSAPLRPNRSQRTETPRELTPERMMDLTPQERAMEYQSFRRGGGG